MSSASATPLSFERPFLGLKPYGYAERGYFFGRKVQSYALYNLVQQNQFVAVVGSSGSGKSSLVRAGLRPILEEEKKIGGLEWTWLEMRPGDAPLTALLDSLTTLASDDPAIASTQKERMAFELRQSSFGIVKALERLDDSGAGPIVLVVDQFEELFRFSERGDGLRSAHGDPHNEATHFVQLLLEASRARRRKVHVLLTMRSDFIGECARFHGLPEAVSAAQFLVPALTRDQTEQVIRKPLEKVGSSIDSILVERLLNDSSEEPDQLPVLQHCLLRLWNAAKPKPVNESGETAPGERSDGPTGHAPARHITTTHYESAGVGGISNALSRHAEEVYASLSGVTLAVEQAFRALGELDREGRAIRRARLFSELVAETGVDSEDLRRVVKRFAEDDCSFLVATAVKSPPDTRIDVGHEALLRRWKRVSGEPDAVRGETASRTNESQGWLKAEERDGHRYRGLVSLIENEGKSDAGFEKHAEERWSWWTSRPRTPAWAARYGGRFEEVKQLLLDGLARNKQLLLDELARKKRLVRQKRVAVAAMVSVGCLVLIAGSIGYKMHQDGLEEQKAVLALKHARKIVDQVPLTNDGSMRIGQQKELLAVATDIARDASASINPRTADLSIRLQIKGSDISLRAGDVEDALERAELARDEARKMMRLEPAETKWQYWEVEGLHRAENARLRLDGMTVDQGLRRLVYAESVVQRLADGAAPCDVDGLNHRQRLIYVRNQISDFLTKKRDFTAALEESNKALADAEKFGAEAPGCLLWPREIGNSKDRIGAILLEKGDVASALQTQKDALDTRMKLARGSNDNSLHSNVALSHDKIGDIWAHQAKYDEALASYGAALTIRKELVDRDPGNAGSQNFLAISYRHVGDVYAALPQQVEKARENYRQLVATRRLLATRDSSDKRLQSAWENSVAVLAKYESAQEDYSAAIEAYRPLIAVQIKLAKDRSDDASRPQALLDTVLKIGKAYQAAGSRDGAIKTYQQVFEELEPLVATNRAVAPLRERIQTEIQKLTSAD